MVPLLLLVLLVLLVLLGLGLGLGGMRLWPPFADKPLRWTSLPVIKTAITRITTLLTTL